MKLVLIILAAVTLLALVPAIISNASAPQPQTTANSDADAMRCEQAKADAEPIFRKLKGNG